MFAISGYQQELDKIALYPNPTQGIISFDNSKSALEKVAVYNYLGQQVLKPFDCTGQDNVSIDLGTFPSGVYFIKLERKGMTNTVKVVKE